MELKRRFSFRKFFTIIYIVSFLAYIGFYIVSPDGIAYMFDGGLLIPSIDLTSGVTKLELKNNKLDTPDSIVGSYARNTNKTLLIGHSSTVFKNLDQVNVSDTVIYNNIKYAITNVETFKKSDISMSNILKSEEKNTLILMTCAGTPVGEKDATHRLIVTAQEI